jgi:hypothetical protein
MGEDFRNEARAVSRLWGSDGHENIVRVFRYGVLPSPFYYYFDMELCDGTLEEVVIKTALPVK